MQTTKNILLFLLIISFSGFLGYFFEPDQPVSAIVAMSFLGFFIFNLIVRNSMAFQGYFTSPLNVFTSKVRTEKTYDIPKELMFEKVKEVIADSSFRLKGTNEQTFEVLATTRLTFKSWGENMYIKCIEQGDQTVMKVCSLTFFQMVSWGKNEQNCNNLLNEIENSLTV